MYKIVRASSLDITEAINECEEAINKLVGQGYVIAGGHTITTVPNPSSRQSPAVRQRYVVCQSVVFVGRPVFIPTEN